MASISASSFRVSCCLLLVICLSAWATNVTSLSVGEIFSPDCSRKCLAVPPQHTLIDGARVIQWECDGSEHQQWEFEPVGYAFRIKLTSSGKCLAIQDASPAPGALAVQVNCSVTDPRPEQLWHISSMGDKRQLRPLHTSQCLKIQLSAYNNGAPLLQWPCTDSFDEHWRVEAVQTPALPSAWEGPFRLPLVAVAAATLPDGKILTWSAYKRFDFLGIGVGKTYTAIFDPVTMTNTEALVQNTHHDMFCPGTAQLGDGRIMITGGSDSNATTLYDPATNTWSVGPQTIIPRGYHSMAALRDGSVFTIGGSFSGGEGNKTGELWNVTTEEWTVKANLLGTTLLTNDARGLYRSDNHMWLQVAPNGRIFHAGPSAQMHWMDVDGDGTIEPSLLRGDDTDAMNGNAVMYDIGKILTLGGAPSYENSPSSYRAYVISIDGYETSVERVGDMSYPRSFSSSVVLPTGEVVVVGGMSWAYIFSDEGSVRTAEIWNPTTQQFSMLAEMQVPRNYHGIAILLKDGRVMAAGSGLCGNCTVNHNDTEILTPPYLLSSDLTEATRPVIVSAPTTIVPGARFDVVMDSDVSHTFALVRTSVVTHAVNNDQRRIPLKVVKVNGNTFTVSIPSNPNVVLPGNYFLFAMNGNNVPSVAEVVNRPNQYTSVPIADLEQASLEESTNPSPSKVKSPAVINMEAATNVALLIVVLMCSIPLRRKLLSMVTPPDVVSAVDDEFESEFV